VTDSTASKPKLPREYYCHACRHLRLDLRGVVKCGNCKSTNIEFGEVNSPKLTALRDSKPPANSGRDGEPMTLICILPKEGT
jgi:hypothetical protein